MKKQIEGIVLTNRENQRLRIYAVENSSSPEFCIEVEGSDDYFSFTLQEKDELIKAINEVTNL